MTDARTTQASLEQWLMPNARAQIAQVAIEVWAPGGSTTPQAIATLVALEQWAPAAIAVTPTTQARAWIMA